MDEIEPLPGTRVIRLIPSTTGRNIVPGDVGVIGGVQPWAWGNPPSFSGYEWIPVQWIRTGLWSSMNSNAEFGTWKYEVYPEDEEPLAD
jgi:hypothetical protein